MHEDTVSFWEDLIAGKIHSSTYPNLFRSAIDPKASFWKLRSSSDLLECFKIPMTRQAYDEFWNCKRSSHLCLIALKLKKMFGPLFGGSKDSRQVNTTTTSSKMCSLRGQSFGFRKPNVFPRSSSLDGSCSLTNLTQGIC